MQPLHESLHESLHGSSKEPRPIVVVVIHEKSIGERYPFVTLPCDASNVQSTSPWAV